MGGASLVTGLAIYKPVQFRWLTTLCGGYESARFLHFWLAMAYVGFFVIHIVQVLRAGWPNLRAMIAGDEGLGLDSESARNSRRRLAASFAVGTSLAALGLCLWLGLRHSRQQDSQPWLLRRSFAFNSAVSQRFFRPDHLSREFARDQARKPRVNGLLGMEDEDQAFDPSSWSLHVEAPGKHLTLTLDDIKRLPHVEITTQLRCIEGWSEIVSWGGARLSDLLARYDLVPRPFLNPSSQILRNPLTLGFSTPDDGYYVGIDLATALHPQTLLAYEMNGAPLTIDHGAPLRLATAIKYGIKSIKRVGKLVIQQGRAPDYWAEQGYDWDSGQ
jgi:DMSO/TMAO reductase YedYZ molybdopterin-dependent catalytic subunit